MEEDKKTYIRTMKKLIDSFWNCNVCLVGGKWDEKEDLSKFDRVVWVNNHYRESQPIDGLVTISALRPDKFYPRLKMLLVQVPGPHLDMWKSLSSETVLTYCPFIHKDGECPEGHINAPFQRFAQEVNTRPFTGMQAVNFLLQLPIKSLYVTGMTFYQREEDGLIPFQVGPHRIQPQLEWLGRTAEYDYRLKLSESLDKICPRPERADMIIKTHERDHFTIWRAEAIARRSVNNHSDT